MRIGVHGLAGEVCRIGLLVGLVMTLANRVEATASIGACCPTSGACISTSEFSCEQGGGTFLGAGTSCTNASCDANTAVPVFSFLGLVGMVGALAGVGLYRLIRRPPPSASGAA